MVKKLSKDEMDFIQNPKGYIENEINQIFLEAIGEGVKRIVKQITTIHKMTGLNHGNKKITNRSKRLSIPKQDIGNIKQIRERKS
jgi:hypothetical protein